MPEQTVTLRVEGMTCQHCVSAVRNAVMGVPSVKSSDVDLKAGLATVVLDPSKASLEDLLEAVEEAGYEARPVS